MQESTKNTPPICLLAKRQMWLLIWQDLKNF